MLKIRQNVTFSCQGWIYLDGGPGAVWLVEDKPASIFFSLQQAKKKSFGVSGRLNWWGHLCSGTPQPPLNPGVLPCLSQQSIEKLYHII